MKSASAFVNWLKGLFDRRPPYCKQCDREETRPEFVKKSQCSFCYGPLIPGNKRFEGREPP